MLVQTAILFCIGQNLFEAMKVLFFPFKKELLNPGGEVLHLFGRFEPSIGVSDSGRLQRDVAMGLQRGKLTDYLVSITLHLFRCDCGFNRNPRAALLSCGEDPGEKFSLTWLKPKVDLVHVT